ncbi:MAG: RnfABCDGE type electron transport complex subunit D [Deltaproteobacteria bacterium]|nr:RnfABCDGE type electron transport complex subunit D [Deltaproteobacteria bacterium]
MTVTPERPSGATSASELLAPQSTEAGLELRPRALAESAFRSFRARIGAKGAFVLHLLPLVLVAGALRGAGALLIIGATTALTMIIGAFARAVSGESYRLFHPGSLATGLLLALTLPADLPLYMILVGAAVAAIPGKHRLPVLGRNLLNPAALGRVAIGLLEALDPRAHSTPGPDVVSSASVLMKTAGGHARPEVIDLLLEPGVAALGETSVLLTIICGLSLCLTVVLKRQAAFAMICATPVFVLAMVPTTEIIGHAPWTGQPPVYLLASSTLFTAFFFATDPVTTPSTRIGGLLFGAGAAFVSVLLRFYTNVAGPELFGILLMNIATPWLDELLRAREPSTPETPSEEVAGDAGPVRPQSGLVATGDAAGSPPLSGEPERPAPGVRTLQAPPARKLLLPLDTHNLGAVPPGQGLARARRIGPEGVIEEIARSELLGFGGALFPVGRKWAMARARPGPRVLVVNAQEGEPGSAKDEAILRERPSDAAEGIFIAAFAIGALEVRVVTGPDHDPEPLGLAFENLAEICRREGHEPPTLTLTKGPGRYVAGEESALLELLEGRRVEARRRPPYPVEAGLGGRPTLIQNLETLAWVTSILGRGADWYLAERPKLFTIMGGVRRPGVYEAPLGSTLSSILDRAGGVVGEFVAVRVGGPAGGYLLPSELDVAVDPLTLSSASLGTGAIHVLADDGVNSRSACPVFDVAQAAEFFANETCGRCTPCRVGTRAMAGRIRRLDEGGDDEGSRDLSAVEDLAMALELASTCGLGSSAPRLVRSLLSQFPEIVAEHQRRECRRCHVTRTNERNGVFE